MNYIKKFYFDAFTNNTIKRSLTDRTEKPNKMTLKQLRIKLLESNKVQFKPMFTKAAYVNINQYSNSMPDVRGMSLLQAKIVLRQMGYKIKFSGSGQVAWQSPKHGTDLIEGSVCIIGLQ